MSASVTHAVFNSFLENNGALWHGEIRYCVSGCGNKTIFVYKTQSLLGVLRAFLNMHKNIIKHCQTYPLMPACFLSSAS